MPVPGETLSDLTLWNSNKGSTRSSRPPEILDRIVGPLVGSILGLVVLLAVIIFIRKMKSRSARKNPVEIKDVDGESESGDSRIETPQPQSEIIGPKELETVEIY